MRQKLRALIKHGAFAIIFIGSTWLQGCTKEIDHLVTAGRLDNFEGQTETSPEFAIVDTATATYPTSAPTTTATPVPTPSNGPTWVSNIEHDAAPEFPERFVPETMKPGVSPVAYLPSACQYLENRWGEDKSTPGTVVVPIMFHSIVSPGRQISDTTSISMAYFEYFMETAVELGFSTITSQQLVDFLKYNQAIPERSMLLILDDRRPGVTELFMPYLEEQNWTLTLGWIATDSTRDSVWETMTSLASTGRLDVQSHGYNHIYIQDYTTTEQIKEELYQPIEVIEARFGKRPIAHVWPGGNFDARAVAIAVEAGYQIGFTVYSRGPIMYNWIPLGEPEMSMETPLLVLPRFWSTAAVQALNEAVMVSDAAREYAKSVDEAEREYYYYYCYAKGSE